MTRRTDQIGFSQRVRLEWFEQTANLILAGNDKVAVNDALQELLEDKVSVGGQAKRGNREKIITILLKTWLMVPCELESLRVEGLELLKRVPRRDHMAVHWGMVMAVYPFWSGVAVLYGMIVPATTLMPASLARSYMARSSRVTNAAGRPWYTSLTPAMITTIAGFAATTSRSKRA